MSIDKLDFNNSANVEGEWFINENLYLAFLSVLASDSVLSDTSTDVDNDPLSAIDALTSLNTPVTSSLMLDEKISEAQGAFFEVPAKHKGQKLILFGRFEFEPITRKRSEDKDESPQFSHYGPSAHHMMEKIGYNLTKRFGLNSIKEDEHYYDLSCQKRKPPITIIEHYYDKGFPSYASRASFTSYHVTEHEQP